MKAHRKVVWAEGIFLGQQHFQQWERYFEYISDTAQRALHPFGWGLISQTYDEESLDRGIFRLRSCSVIFPNRVVANYVETEDGPLTYDLGRSGELEIDLYLCIPANRQVAGVVGYRDHRLPAWVVDYRSVEDDNDPEREREVAVAKANLMILTGSDSLDNVSSLHLAKLTSLGDGRYRVADAHIPPSVHIGASPVLRKQIQRVVELLEAKSRLISERLGDNGASSDLTHGELGGFLLLLALRRALPEFRHLAKNLNSHPERMYIALARVVEELGAFGSGQEDGASNVDVPPYQHESLAEVFSVLDRMLLQRIEQGTPTKSAQIRFVRASENQYEADSIDSKVLANSDFYLAVFSEAEGTDWISAFARQAKVSSRSTLGMVISSALPGVRLVHTQRPPSKLSVRAGYEYFRLEPKGDFWDSIIDDQSIALFVPRDFVKAKIELLTVQE